MGDVGVHRFLGELARDRKIVVPTMLVMTELDARDADEVMSAASCPLVGFAAVNLLRWHAIWYGLVKRKGWCCLACCCLATDRAALLLAAICFALVALHCSQMVIAAIRYQPDFVSVSLARDVISFFCFLRGFNFYSDWYPKWCALLFREKTRLAGACGVSLDFLFWAVFYAFFVAELLRMWRQLGKEPLLGDTASPEVEDLPPVSPIPQQSEMPETVRLDLREALAAHGRP